MRPVHRLAVPARITALPRVRMLSVALLSVTLVGSSLVAPPPAAASASTNREASLLERINGARVDHGLAPLSAKPGLMTYAREHSVHMAARTDLFHTSNFAFVCCWSAIGENVAYNVTVRRAHLAFMGSPGHRANILDPHMRRVGVGVIERAGRLWVTEVFTKPA